MGYRRSWMITPLLVLHGAFFSLFLLRLSGLMGPRSAGRSGVAPASAKVHASPRADALLLAHGAAFSAFYLALGSTLGSDHRAEEPSRAVLGGLIIAMAVGLLAWTLIVFRSWRLLAELDIGHELCTAGPFRLIRHPIYLACDLLVLGTAIWVAAPSVWLGAALVVVGGDLRGRAEERILLEAFGDRYREYRDRTSRLIPGLY